MAWTDPVPEGWDVHPGWMVWSKNRSIASGRNLDRVDAIARWDRAAVQAILRSSQGKYHLYRNNARGHIASAPDLQTAIALYELLTK